MLQSELPNYYNSLLNGPDETPNKLESSYLYSQFGSDDEDEEETDGKALDDVKLKWRELGPLKLEEIINSSSVPID